MYIFRILTDIVSFDKNGHFSEKHIVIHSTNLGCGRLGAQICLQYASVCIRMHPYASVCTHMPPYALFTPSNANVQHRFSPNSSKSKKNSRNRLFCNAIRNVKSMQIQPIIAILKETCKKHNNYFGPKIDLYRISHILCKIIVAFRTATSARIPEQPSSMTFLSRRSWSPQRRRGKN